MDDPFRLRVMKAICERLKLIAPENGFQHDLRDYTDAADRPAERVFRGRLSFGDSDPLPLLAVLEDPRSIDPANGTGSSPMAKNTFRVLVQGFVREDHSHPLDPAYKLSAEVIKTLVAGKQDRFNILGMGNRAPCVLELSIGQPVHRPPDDEVSSTAYFVVGVTLTLAENLEAPFA